MRRTYTSAVIAAASDAILYHYSIRDILCLSTLFLAFTNPVCPIRCTRLLTGFVRSAVPQVTHLVFPIRCTLSISHLTHLDCLNRYSPGLSEPVHASDGLWLLRRGCISALTLLVCPIRCTLSVPYIIHLDDPIRYSPGSPDTVLTWSV